jgi:adenosine deaminase
MSPEFLEQLPKVELHVHLEGSIRPETLLRLAERNRISLPATDTAGLAEWYRFRDFSHFVEVYVAVSKCIQKPEDLELVMLEFLQNQASENIIYSEVTFTASTIAKYAGIPWNEQIDALQRALVRGPEIGSEAQLIIDIVRGDSAARAQEVMEWVDAEHGQGVCALGVAGEERFGIEPYREVFQKADQLGIPVVAHAGEFGGPESIRAALEIGRAVRIGHGVRCLEDITLVDELVQKQTPIEVCPSSNVCLGVFPTLAEHPLGKMLDAGLNVSVNSDDPPMFGTTLTDEWKRVCTEFSFNEDIFFSLMKNAINAALISSEQKESYRSRLRESFSALS